LTGKAVKAERYAPELYALLRVVFGFLYMCHGLQKFGLFDDRSPVPLASLLGVAAVIELIAGPLLIAGLLTRAAAFVASGEMAAAYFISHQPDGVWPIQNNGELAALYCFAFLYVFARGAGRYSIDHALAMRAMTPDRRSMAPIP
jgi:putative oxidoreductase